MHRKEFSPEMALYYSLYKSVIQNLDNVGADIIYHALTRFGSKRCSLLITSMACRHLWLRALLDETAETVISCFHNFIISVQRKTKVITIDRAPCFRPKAFDQWCIENSILLEFCSPDKHQSNVFAKRVIQTIRTKALAMLNDARLSKKFIFDTLEYATTLLPILR